MRDGMVALAAGRRLVKRDESTAIGGLPRVRLTRRVCLLRTRRRAAGTWPQTLSSEFAEGTLTPAAVVDLLDPGDDREAELVAGGPLAVVQDVLLQQSEDGRHRGTVVSRRDPSNGPRSPPSRRTRGNSVKWN